MSLPIISEKLSTPEPRLPHPPWLTFSPLKGSGGLQAPVPEHRPHHTAYHNVVECKISFVLNRVGHLDAP